MDAGSLVTVPLSGCYDTHTLRVTLGGAQTFDLNLDTGASTLGVASQACSGCEDAGVSPLYQPGAGAVDLGQPETLMYAPGFGWSGEAYRDTVTIGGMTVPVALVAMTSQTSYFTVPSECDTPTGMVAAPYEGTIGFGPDAFLLPGTNDYIDQAVAAGAPDVFTVSFCHEGGTLWIGGYDPASMSGPLLSTPMGQNAGYTVEWTDARVGGTHVALPSGTTATVDSGGDEIIVPSSTFSSLAAALAADPAFQAVFGASFFSASAQPFQNCKTVDELPAAIDAALPLLTLVLRASNPVDVKLTRHGVLPRLHVCGAVVGHVLPGRLSRTGRRARTVSRPEPDARARPRLRPGAVALRDRSGRPAVPVLKTSMTRHNPGARVIAESVRRQVPLEVAGTGLGVRHGDVAVGAHEVRRVPREPGVVIALPPGERRQGHAPAVGRLHLARRRKLAVDLQLPVERGQRSVVVLASVLRGDPGQAIAAMDLALPCPR